MSDAAADRPSGLLHEISRSVFWNTALLPLVTIPGVLLSIIIRRSFGLESGIYDAVLGVANSILFYSSLGLSGSLPKFLPELQVRAGREATSTLLWRVAATRVAIVVGILVPLNLWAVPIVRWLDLGPDGPLYLRWLSILVIGRATLDLLYRALDSFLQQLAVNVISLLNGVLDVGLVALVIVAGMHISGVVGALAASAVIVSIVALVVVRKRLDTLPHRPADSSAPVTGLSRMWKLSTLTYVRDLSLYFATPAFASPVLLTMLGGPEPVAIFATSYFVASSTVTLAISGFRGVYKPAFARVLNAGDHVQLERAFDLMNKIQILAVVPAGFGLAVMVSDYLPLLYGQSFVPAVPVARVLVALLFAETALAVAPLVLWVDERYGPVLLAQLPMIAGAPLFVWVAGRHGIFSAAIVLGGSRVASSVIGCIAARRIYGVRYPLGFAVRVAAVSSVMAGVLLILQRWWNTSIWEAIAMTLLGIVIVLVGLRWFRVMGPAELDVLSRASIPGKHALGRWLGAGARISR